MGDRTIVESVHDLNRNFGPTLVAYMADVRSRQMPKKWETGLPPVWLTLGVGGS